MPPGGRVGTASMRRTAELLALRPDLVVEPVRGNVDTRLRKRTERGLDGVLLAACGLERLGLDAEIGFRLDVDDLLPEVGQGVVALQTRRADVARRRRARRRRRHAALRAERACVARLGGGCTAPVAAHAARRGRLWLRGWVGRPDGGESRGRTGAATTRRRWRRGRRAAAGRGGAELLAAVRA